MLGEEKISGRQAVNLIITTLLSGSIIVTSAIHKQANRDSWLAILLSTALALLAGTVIAALGRRFPDQTIIQYGRQLFGRLPGMALGLLFVVLFLYMSILITRWVTELLITMFMPDTPLVVFAISFVGVCAYGVRHGLDVLARTNDIFLPVALALLFFILISNSPDMKIQNFFPVLEEGVMPVLKGALPQAAILAQSIIMVMLTPFLNKPREVKGVIFRGVITTGLLALLIMVSSISVLGNRTDRTMFVLLLLSRQINIGEVIERVEPFVLLLWLSIGVTS
ncbi:hypothetical protein P378_20635 [Desulforamulus profundi]|uniref:Spore germination protein n=1 Tax=Desulforamulus profundi TaxID=1383067 RepID=A0A2C6M9R3_9FIRM|nr:endospore germination permease [Desulforamulus profundi]PHJ36718.1 hypothetical protein P378_20635 [Desulforamulus profundi]